MTAEVSMNHVGIFCAIVVTAFTSLPWGRLLFSALRVPRKRNLH